MRRPSGLTLIETMFAMAILAFVMGAVFLAFSQSSRSFRHTLLRQGLQGDAVKMESLFGRDIRITDYHSNQVVNRSFTTSDGRTVSRDGLSVAALSDWNDSTKFHTVTSLPLWDQHVVYYVTDDGDSGRLVRQVIDGGGPTNGFPYFAFSGNMNSDPSLNTSVLSTNLISSQVDHFQVASDDGTQGFDVVLRLRRRAGLRRSGGLKKVDETLETRYSPVALNTFPKL